MRHLSTLVLMALLGCATQPQQSEPATPAAFDTTVRGRNIRDVSRDVQQWHDMMHPECKFVRVTATNIVNQEQDKAVEHWTIEACDQKPFTYRVMVIHRGNGILDSVGNVDGSPLKVGNRE